MSKFKMSEKLMEAVILLDAWIGEDPDLRKHRNALEIIRTALLTQAAEIERGDKVVVPREPTDEILRRADEVFWSKTTIDYVELYKVMITASEGK